MDAAGVIGRADLNADALNCNFLLHNGLHEATDEVTVGAYTGRVFFHSLRKFMAKMTKRMMNLLIKRCVLSAREMTTMLKF